MGPRSSGDVRVEPQPLRGRRVERSMVFVQVACGVIVSAALGKGGKELGRYALLSLGMADSRRWRGHARGAESLCRY